MASDRPLEDLRARLQAGAAGFAPLFDRPVLADVPELRLCTLVEFPEQALIPGEDMTACVTTQLFGTGPGATAILSFEPEAALELLAASGPSEGADPLVRFCELGAAMIHALSQVMLGEAATPSPPALIEDTVAGTLLRTHAPADTALLSARIVVADEETAWGGVLYLLLDPKSLAKLTEDL